ncbi:FG-GAP-like repeat-containing protein [Winogradskyella pulchriflava]|uniref:FG-GAP-like repeat-containing protein n=1 Tax=Winogradskyella pulchriflava TaxID=1110688 RepID=A0ABV6Q8B0_9FLAO
MKLVFSITLLSFMLQINAQIAFQNQASIRGINEDTGIVSMGGGISFADFDGDGLDDISLGTGPGESIQFYKNFDGFFVQQDLLPIDLNFQNKSITWVDFDNDGDKDLFVASQTNGNKLFERQDDNSLVDITSSAGFVTDNMFTYGVSWGDVNNDGCLDVYISNYTLQVITNYFYLNNCDGTFSEVTDAVGLSNSPALTFCSGFFDFNNDGWVDLYIANDKTKQNFLYKNNGDGTFMDVSTSSGTDLVVDAMSVTIDDYNNDGYFDIFMTNTPNNEATTIGSTILLKNNGDETFTNVSASSGAQLNSWSWGASFFDAENDMDLDLYVSCSYDGSQGYPSYAFYENNGNETFMNSTTVGLDNTGESFASAIGDIDNDGLEDIIVINNDSSPFLWKNLTITGNDYLKIKLIGTISNADGIGAKIEVLSNGVTQYRYTMCGEGYLSQNSSIETFGVGDNTTVENVKVTWPSGVVDVFNNVTSNQLFTITEGITLSSNDFENDSKLKVLNPVNDFVYIGTDKTISKLIIYDLQGKIILDTEILGSDTKINVSNLTSGIYIGKLEFIDGILEVFKFFKI